MYTLQLGGAKKGASAITADGVQSMLEVMKEPDMQMFGNTCPMCCGDVRPYSAVCVFCGFTSGSDCSAKDTPGISAWPKVDGAKCIATGPTVLLVEVLRGLPESRRSFDETTNLV